MHTLQPTPILMLELPLNSRMPSVGSAVETQPPISDSPRSEPRLIRDMHPNDVGRRGPSPTEPDHARGIGRINRPHGTGTARGHGTPPVGHDGRQPGRPVDPLEPGRRGTGSGGRRRTVGRNVGGGVLGTGGVRFRHRQQDGADGGTHHEIGSAKRPRHPTRAHRFDARHQFHLCNPPTRVYRE